MLFLGCVRSQIAEKVLYCTAVVVEAGPQKEEAGRGCSFVLSLALSGKVGDWVIIRLYPCLCLWVGPMPSTCLPLGCRKVTLFSNMPKVLVQQTRMAGYHQAGWWCARALKIFQGVLTAETLLPPPYPHPFLLKRKHFVKGQPIGACVTKVLPSCFGKGRS